VSSIAAVNLLTGGLFLGLAFLFSLPSHGSLMDIDFPRVPPVLAVAGAVHLLAAGAVWKRWRWGRILAIVLSTLYTLQAVSALLYATVSLPLLLVVLVLLAWAAYPSIVLLQRRYAAEFPPLFSRAG
jgi:hypothetical protein